MEAVLSLSTNSRIMEQGNCVSREPNGKMVEEPSIAECGKSAARPVKLWHMRAESTSPQPTPGQTPENPPWLKSRAITELTTTYMHTFSELTTKLPRVVTRRLSLNWYHELVQQTPGATS